METLKENNDLRNDNTDPQAFTENGEPETVGKECSLKKDNRGIGVVEIVLILVVLIALIIIFKDKIIEIINSAFESISEGANSL